MNNGALVISLDFELYWSLKNKIPIEKCREDILGARNAIPLVLELFNKYGGRFFFMLNK